jgi:hypothetical protein
MSTGARAAPILAHLQAQAPGSSTLSSATDHSCFYANPGCGLPGQEWEVTIQALP